MFAFLYINQLSNHHKSTIKDEEDRNIIWNGKHLSTGIC